MRRQVRMGWCLTGRLHAREGSGGRGLGRGDLDHWHNDHLMLLLEMEGRSCCDWLFVCDRGCHGGLGRLRVLLEVVVIGVPWGEVAWVERWNYFLFVPC